MCSPKDTYHDVHSEIISNSFNGVSQRSNIMDRCHNVEQKPDIGEYV